MTLPTAETAAAQTKRSGLLGRAMRYYAFRKLLGRDRRRKAWIALGADISSTAVVGPRVNIRFPGMVSIGAGSSIGGRVWIDSWGPVSIGENVLLNGDIDLLTTQHILDHPRFEAERRAISIGDYAWLPLKIVVLPGVSIGKCAVVGTGSVVASDVEDYAVVAGNPARVVGERARIDYKYIPSPIPPRRPDPPPSATGLADSFDTADAMNDDSV
jgi:acetyltransferase-like isoleucine patch superfamily enzyme